MGDREERIESDEKIDVYQESFLNSEQLEENLKANDEQTLIDENSSSAKKTRFKVKKIDFTMNKDQSNDDDDVQEQMIKKDDGSTNSSAINSQAGSENDYNTQYNQSLRHYTRESLPKGWSINF